ncbi:MAG: HEAT repeat domain-containing protein [Bryobacteraceae bacterium]
MARPELEFFLLSIVYDYPLPCATLEYPHLGEHVNRHAPAFTREELIDTLSEMFRAGDLIARRYTMGSHGRWFVPATTEIDAAVCGALNLEYGLTPQGGARWEAMSEFDWNYHLGDFREDGFASASREMIETYLSWTGWSHGHEVTPATEWWSFHRPWRATYWKNLPEGIRIHYEEGPDREPLPQRYAVIGDLWSREWNQRRDCEMRRFVPMAFPGTEAVAGTRWRIRLAEVANREVKALPPLLDAADPALQYAAGLRLAQSGNHVSILVEWFLKRRRRYALRAIAGIHEPQVLDALVEVFQNEPLDIFDDPFVNQLGRAIGAYGEAAVTKIAPLLESESVEMQREVLTVLARTGSPAAGSLILDWLATLKPDPGGNYPHTVPTALNALASLKELRALPLLARVVTCKPHWATQPLILFDVPEAWRILENFIRSEAPISERTAAARQMAGANASYQDEYQRLKDQYAAERLRLDTIWLVTGDWCVEIDEPIAALLGVLKNPDPELRVTAITLICRHDKPFPTAGIAGMLLDPVPEVRANAVYAIGIRGSTNDLSLVEPLLEDPSGVVRYCAREALRRLRSETSSC